MTMNQRVYTSCVAALLSMIAVLLIGCTGNSPEALLASAKELLAKNDSKAAVIQLKNVLQKKPDTAEARFLLGKILLEGDDAAAAERELRKARDLNYPPGEVNPLLARALVK